MENIIINLQIGEEEIQSFAEANFGRELTEIELYRLKEYWYECEDADWSKTEFMANCIEDAMNNEDKSWEHVDKEFREKHSQDQKLPT
ncbi:MAG: hypothetical protein HYW77_00680 [Parcubacteria group bacterium]|nr:hypothetical protein [Parcubacteria group bacterium]